MRISFIVNSRSRKFSSFTSEFEKSKHPLITDARILYTKSPGHARELAQEEAISSELIIAAGGDGTLHEVLNGMMASQELFGGKIPGLGLIPLGSANDFARIQNISNDLNRLIDSIEKGNFKKIDIGKIQLSYDNKTHYFINVADSGIGGEVVEKLEKRSFLKKYISSDVKFASAILRTFFSYRRKHVDILIDNKTQINGRILTLVAANSSSFGSGLIVAPDAKIDDGKFQVLVGDISLWGYLTSMRKLKKGQKLTLKGVQYLEATQIKISGCSDLFTEADGELIGNGEVAITCIPGAIKFCLPELNNRVNPSPSHPDKWN